MPLFLDRTGKKKTKSELEAEKMSTTERIKALGRGVLQVFKGGAPLTPRKKKK